MEGIIFIIYYLYLFVFRFHFIAKKIESVPDPFSTYDGTMVKHFFN